VQDINLDIPHHDAEHLSQGRQTRWR